MRIDFSAAAMLIGNTTNSLMNLSYWISPFKAIYLPSMMFEVNLAKSFSSFEKILAVIEFVLSVILKVIIVLPLLSVFISVLNMQPWIVTLPESSVIEAMLTGVSLKGLPIISSSLFSFALPLLSLFMGFKASDIILFSSSK